MSATTPTLANGRRRLIRLAIAAALFFAIWGAKLTVIDQFGSDLPFWDQWAKEGDFLYSHWLDRGELWSNLFSPHNEHRIVPTLVTNLGLVMLSGQWDARVQCMVNAALHAAVLIGLFWWASRRVSLTCALGIAALLALLGAAPITWENLLSGFQSQFYFLAGFSLLGLGGLLLNPAFSVRWWGGVVAAALALLSMGSGLLIVAPIVAIVGLRLRSGTIARRDWVVTLLAAGVVAGTGLALHTAVPGHAPLRSSHFLTFASYAAHCLSWPFVGQAWLGFILWSPWLLLAGLRLRRLFRHRNVDSAPETPDPTEDFVLAGGLWVLTQIAAVSYSRGGSGELPANRYGDLFGLGLAFSLFALVWLAHRYSRVRRLAGVWALVATLCLLLGARVSWSTSLQLKRADNAAFETNVQEFVVSDDYAAFAKQPIPFPNAEWLARILRHPLLRTILPASVRPPISVSGLEGNAGDIVPKLPFRATRAITAPGEWHSAPIHAGKDWWRIETRGRLGAGATSLQIVAVSDGRVLQSVVPRQNRDAWQSSFVRAPRESARLVARLDQLDNAFAFSEPTEVSTLSYRALGICQLGPSLLGLAVLTGVVFAIRLLPSARSPTGTKAPDNSLSAKGGFAETRPFQMKFFTVTALLAAALFSAVVAVPFLPAAKTRPDLFVLEARVSSTVNGTLQAFYDDGTGLREELSARATLSAGPAFNAYRLPLPPGTYKALRLDPLDRGGSIRIASLRVLSPAGRTVAELPLADLKPTHQIQSLGVRDNALEIVAAAGSDDPQTALAFASPLVVDASWRDYTRGSLIYVGPIFIGLAALLFLLDRVPGIPDFFARCARELARRPTRAVGVVAALAVIVSAYPVVFLGKSYVSPNLGTILLYDTYPTLPGYKSGEVVDVKLSDIGAVMWQHVPFSMMQHRALAQGELPLWNRYNAAGVPLLAQGQSMFGDPLHLLVVAANGAAWAWDLKYVIAKWLFATGLGLIVLALLSGRTAVAPNSHAAPAHALPAALLVALSAPFIGFFLYRINHPAFFSLCYAPWPLYCLVRLAYASSRRAIALSAAGLILANLALMNSGTVKEAYMLLLCVNFSGACVLLANAATWRERGAKLAVVGWAGLLFALLTAPIWATFLTTLKNAYTGYNAVSAYQIQPTLLLGAFDEIFYRPLMARDQVFSPSLNFLLLLGVLYFLATLRLHFANRTVIALAVSSLLPLSLAFGLISPQWIVTLPFLGNIAHLDNTFSCALIVLWSVIAGLGFATAAQRLGTREGRHDLVIAGLLLGALVFGWIAFRQASHRPIFGPTFTVNQPGQVLAISPFIWDYLGALLVAAVALGVLAHRTFARRSLTTARGLLIALCVATLLWRHGLHANTVGFESFTARPTERVNFHARSEAMAWARAAHTREPGRGFGLQGNFFPGWTGVYGLETIHGPDALVNPWLRELAGASGMERLWDWRLYADAGQVAKVQPFLDALNVRFYFDMLSKNPALTKSLMFAKGADLDVYESPTAWPRAFFTDRIDAYDQPAQLVEKIRGAAGKPFAAVQRTDPAAHEVLARIPTDVASRTSVPADHYRLTENTTSFHVRATGPGVICLTEALWPGDFRAEVNQRKAPVVRLNHAFKGVVIDAAGDYTVTFRYWPKSFPRNLALCGIGAVLLLASLIFALRPARTA